MQSSVEYKLNRKMKILILFSFFTCLLIAFVYVNLDIYDTSYTLDFEDLMAMKPSDHSYFPNDTEYYKKYLFCLIKTTPDALKNNKTLTAYKIWASRCSNYRFITLIPKELLHTALSYGRHREIAHPLYILQPEGLKVCKEKKTIYDANV